MFTAILYEFLSAWLLGVIALLLGRFVKSKDIKFPKNISGILIIYIKVWGVVFFSKATFSYLALLMNYGDDYSFVNFLFPIIIGSVFARHLLKKSH